MSSAVLDASAVLALLNGELGAAKVQRHVPGAAISTVNVSEVLAKLMEAGMPENVAAATMASLGLQIVDFDQPSAHRAAVLRSLTRNLGLSLGGRACLALAEKLGCSALTADKSWTRLQLGIPVVAIR